MGSGVVVWRRRSFLLRPFGAMALLLTTHGSRRRLHSFAASRLWALSNLNFSKLLRHRTTDTVFTPHPASSTLKQTVSLAFLSGKS